MKLEEICKFYAHKHTNTCICGKLHLVLTKLANDPEYDTLIYIPCECGEWIEFILPVN